VYAVGYTSSEGAGATSFLITKYNTGGSLIWQRILYGSGVDIMYDVVVDSDDNLRVIGYTNTDGEGSNDILYAVLPSDGSDTGTYGDFTYAASTLTPSTGTLTNNTTPGMIDAVETLVQDNPVVVDQAVTLTETTVI